MNSRVVKGSNMAFKNGCSLVIGNRPQVEKETGCEPVETFNWDSRLYQ